MNDFPLFDFIAAGHPLRASIDRFAARLAERPECRDVIGPEAPKRHAIHAEIKVQPEGGSFCLDRFYWSAQRWDGPEEQPFSALTLTYSARGDATRWLEFPADPYLKAMTDYFAAPGRAVEVLRYVPLRRFTFRERAADGRVRIGKFKRLSRFRDAYARLDTLARELRALGADFAVAAPLGLDEARGLYFQEALPGEDLAAMIDATTLPPLLARVGHLHAGLHALPVREVPAWDGNAFCRNIERDMRWIAFIRPELEITMRRAAILLRQHRPKFEANTFCHGDFVCSQILVGADKWAITDFDLCHLGDRYRDMAILLASLSYDLPWFEARPSAENELAAASAAYLAGYTERAGESPDHRRLAWHRAAAELYYLALRLKKDRFSNAAFDAGLARMRQALNELN